MFRAESPSGGGQGHTIKSLHIWDRLPPARLHRVDQLETRGSDIRACRRHFSFTLQGGQDSISEKPSSASGPVVEEMHPGIP